MKQSSVQKFQFTLQNTDAKQYTIIPLRLKHYISIQGIVQDYNTVYNNTVRTDNNHTVRLTEVHHDTVKCTKKQYSLHQYTYIQNCIQKLSLFSIVPYNTEQLTTK